MADTVVADTMKFYDALPANGTTSLQRDFADGKMTELEYWNGAVVRLGREVSVPTPTNEFIYDSLLPAELRARGRLSFPDADRPAISAVGPQRHIAPPHLGR